MKKLKNRIWLALGLLLFGLQGCTSDDRDNVIIPIDTDQMAYDAADAVNGSRLYNDFTALETGFVAPESASVNLEHITTRKDFYRCKQCHAWDQKARFGSYINRAPSVTRPDVSTVQLTNLGLADIRVLFDGIKGTGGGVVNLERTADGTNPALAGNDHHDYGTILSDDLIWDLVKFLKEGAFDTDGLYAITTVGSYPTGSRTFSDLGRDGDATAGDSFYSSKCASCHGADGTTISLGGNSVGTFTRSSPYEVQHKVVSGQLGASMGATPITFEEMKDLLKALSDETKYPAAN
ncbi:MAG: cytochrome c [Flavobacteriaceae bacterium]|nr:cytochrome c [Flavobacteriaceae bacterium]